MGNQTVKMTMTESPPPGILNDVPEAPGRRWLVFYHPIVLISSSTNGFEAGSFLRLGQEEAMICTEKRLCPLKEPAFFFNDPVRMRKEIINRFVEFVFVDYRRTVP